MRKRIKAKYFDKEYWIKPFSKSGYSPEQGYNRGNYIAGAVAAFLEELYGIKGRWLEAGCAFGWVVEQLIDRQVDAWGFDISKYSINNAPVEIEHRLSCHDGLKTRYQELQDFDVIYSFETAEHIAMEDVAVWLKNLWHWMKPGGKLFMTICLGQNNARGLDDPDESHQTLQSREWWNEQLEGAGFVQDAHKATRAKGIVVETAKMLEPQNLVEFFDWNVFCWRKLDESHSGEKAIC